MPASSGMPSVARAERDDRLAERDEDDQAVALGEVPGREVPAAGAAETAPSESTTIASDPERDLRVAADERAPTTSSATPGAAPYPSRATAPSSSRSPRPTST